MILDDAMIQTTLQERFLIDNPRRNFKRGLLLIDQKLKLQ